MARRSGPVLRRLHEGVAQAAPPGGRVDGQQPDMGAVVALDGGDDAGGRVAEDDRGLVRRKERAVEFVDRRRVGQRPFAQRCDAFSLGRAQPRQRGHGGGRAAAAAALGSTAPG